MRRRWCCEFVRVGPGIKSRHQTPGLIDHPPCELGRLTFGGNSRVECGESPSGGLIQSERHQEARQAIHGDHPARLGGCERPWHLAPSQRGHPRPKLLDFSISRDASIVIRPAIEHKSSCESQDHLRGSPCPQPKTSELPRFWCSCTDHLSVRKVAKKRARIRLG